MISVAGKTLGGVATSDAALASTRHTYGCRRVDIWPANIRRTTREDLGEGWVSCAPTNDQWNNKRSRAASSRGFNGLHHAAAQPVSALAQSLSDVVRKSVTAKCS